MSSKWLPRILLAWGFVMVCFLFGFQVGRQHWFPFNQVMGAINQVKDIRSKLQGNPGGYYVKDERKETVIIHRPKEMAPGLTLMAGVGPKGYLYASIIDANGNAAHHWDLDWFHVWPDAKHIPEFKRPKEHPGVDVHGMWLSQNGDLTYNYNDLGLVQMDICGKVKWRLPHLTHHSVDMDDAGNFWVGDLVLHYKPDPAMPNYHPLYYENGIIQVSPDGKILQRFSLFDILKENGMQGLLYMSAQNHNDTSVCCDMLHENDVEVFKSGMKPDVFKTGDVMVSIRNLNTVIVFDPKTRKIRHLIAGRFIRQHDPDFIDGSTVTVFDNNNVGLAQEQGSSRIVEYSAKTGQTRILFEGTPAHPFYTNEGGKQQRLDNGNILITEMNRGRALEVDPKGELVWEFFNHSDKGLLGVLDQAQRLPPGFMSPDRLKQLSARCTAPAR